MIGLRGLKVAALLARADSFPRSSGWLDSIIHQRSLNADGKAVPWLTYPAIAFLESRVAGGYITKETRVFEYGAGFSTVWWRNQSFYVDSVEHDREWTDRLLNMIDVTYGLQFQTDEAGYVEAISAGDYDIVVIDGEWRNLCADRAVDALSDAGVIIFDNADFAEFRAGVAGLVDRGFRRLDFVGPAPMNHYAHTTSVFYRAGNCLAI